MDALTSTSFADNSRDIIVTMIGRPLKSMIAIAAAVGAALIGLTVWVLTAEQMIDFGVLRAIGVRPAKLRRLVLGQKPESSPRWDFCSGPRLLISSSSASATGWATSCCR